MNDERTCLHCGGPGAKFVSEYVCPTCYINAHPKGQPALFAAAPELLDALEGLLDALSTGMLVHPVNKARAVVAKLKQEND